MRTNNPTPADDAGRRLADVRRRIEAACARAGRDAGGVTLIGASKRQPIQRLEAAIAAGLRVFGESRIQEATEKIPRLPVDLDWHFIGTLQSNKANVAARFFDTVHSLDRAKIARALDRAAERQGRHLKGFIQVHLGTEPTKHGFPEEGLAEAVRPLGGLEHLEIVGLMAIPPWEEDPELRRGWFRRMRELRDGLAAEPEWRGFPGLLSMGMSQDFELAIEEGATHIRVGTCLFGARER